MRIAINGLGRIGRLVLRRMRTLPGLELVAINDLGDPRSLAHLLRYDSVHGRACFEIDHGPAALILAGGSVPCFCEPDPARLPFAELGAELVLDCTGRFRDRASLASHLRGSVTHVLAGCASGDADFTVVPGLNDALLDPAAHQVVAAATPSTHALGLLLKVLHEKFGLERGLATFVHAYTSDQRILDLPHADLRCARAAAASMIPCPTSAPATLVRILPHLEGRLEGMSVRVPTPDVSLVDLTAQLARPADLEELQAAFEAAASGALRELLVINPDELVSSDLVGCSASCAFDPFLTRLLSPTLVKVYGWFDNEWAYACRLVELLSRFDPMPEPDSSRRMPPLGGDFREVHP